MDEQGKQEELDAEDEKLQEFSEYYEGQMPAKEASEFKKRLADDAEYRESYEKFQKTLELLSGMNRMSAPEDFDRQVENTIHERSGGRFFGRKAFGDRIPYELLAILLMLIATGIYWMSRSSDTGSHKMDSAPPEIPAGARDVLPSL